MFVCVSLCTSVVHNTAQNSSYNLPSYPPDNRRTQEMPTGGQGDMLTENNSGSLKCVFAVGLVFIFLVLT